MDWWWGLLVSAVLTTIAIEASTFVHLDPAEAEIVAAGMLVAEALWTAAALMAIVVIRTMVERQDKHARRTGRGRRS